MLVSTFRVYMFLKKVNIGRKTTTSQWLIQSCKLSLPGGGNFNLSNYWCKLWRYEMVFTIKKIKRFIMSFSICSKLTTCCLAQYQLEKALTYQLPSYLVDQSYSEDMCKNSYAIMEVYANECTKNQVCKLFALADRAFTQDMSAMPLEKLKKILSNYWVSCDI